MKLLKNAALFGVALAALAACAQSDRTIANATGELREIEAREKTMMLELRAAQSGFLSEHERGQAAAFVDDFLEMHDSRADLVVTAPKGAANVSAAVSELRVILAKAGVDPAAVVYSSYDAKGEPDAPIVLAYKGYELVVPGCSDLSQHDMGNLNSNTHMPSLGCAVNQNIAMMIANPGDVLGQRTLDAPDSQRQGILLDKYRKGENTQSGQEADGSSTR